MPWMDSPPSLPLFVFPRSAVHFVPSCQPWALVADSFCHPKEIPLRFNRPFMLKKTPPASILEKLKDEGIHPEDLLLCTDTDIDPRGRYTPQWLAVTPERLLVMTNGRSPKCHFDLELSKASEFRTQGVIGSGLLQARVGDLYIDVLRYSNRQAGKFQKVAGKLDGQLHGGGIVIHPEDETDPLRCPKCSLMLESAGDICPRCVDKGAAFSRMWALLRPYRRMVWAVVGLMVAGIALDLVGPQLTRTLVDRVLPGDVAGAAHDRLRLLLTLVGVLAGVQFLRMIVSIFSCRLGNQIGAALTFDMRGRLVKHLQKLSVGYYDRQQVGSLTGRVAYDTEALHGFVMQLTGGFLFQLLMLVGVGVMMFSLNRKLALYTLIPAPIIIAGAIVFWRYIYPRYYRFWDASSKQAGMLAGVLSGIRVVKAFNQERREGERFGVVSERLRQTRLGVDNASAIFNPVMGLVFQLGGWIVWFIGGRDVLGGGMSLGSLMAFFGYLWMFYGPLGSLTTFTNWLTQFVTQAHRIFEILDTTPEIAEVEAPEPIGTLEGRITFEGVSFGYNRNQPVLHGLDVEIAPGEMIGMVGRSGSGKSTIVNLLCRFYDVDAGRVLLDGVDVRHLPREALSRQIGVVLQEPFLFRGSIWENVTYGLPEAAPERVLAAAKAANAHDFIMAQPHGYDTWVGERGAGLSGGERQRVSIARVLLTDPRILILDEATSSIDAESEAAIQAALAELVKGRTTIAIAHRLSTLRNAHRILVIDGGHIAESGTHRELMDEDGLYARLVRAQGEFIPPTIDQISAEDAWRPGGTRLKRDRLMGLAPLGSHHPRWLTPENTLIHIGNMDTLHVTVPDEGTYGGIFAVRTMPIQHPGEYISLRYFSPERREVEVGLIRSLDDWSAVACALVNESLERRAFVHTIQAVRSIEVVNGYLNFKVETDLGPMEFMLRWQSDRAHDYGARGKMLIDTEGNRYLVPDVKRLDPADERLFSRHIYW